MFLKEADYLFFPTETSSEIVYKSKINKKEFRYLHKFMRIFWQNVLKF